jgi:hypothetical protein
LPHHYAKLSEVAAKLGFPYPDKPDLDNYKSIYDADSLLNPS